MSTSAELDPTALRVFSRRFPGATLTGFFALETPGRMERSHCFHFEGDLATLVRLGLIEETMVPPRPKRHAAGFAEEIWSIRRAAGQRLRVMRQVKDSDRDHPLALFCPSNYPFVETTQEAREQYRRDLTDTVAEASDFARGVLRGYMKAGRYGLCIAEEDRARFEAIAAEFGDSLRHAAQAVRIVSAQPVKLRLVANDGVRPGGKLDEALS